MKKFHVQGSMTVEMSFLMPMVLFLIMGCILTAFYYHDKNILSGAAYEYVSVKMEKEEIEVIARASRKYMKVSIMKRAAITEPERRIRKWRLGYRDGT